MTSPALAGDPYADLAGVVRAEVLPGWETGDGRQMAGLRLTLAPGWKTYWRAPGDSGIPPSFNWVGSENLAGVTVHWPRPEVFYQNDMRTIGYKDEVVLPLELTPSEPGQPIALRGAVELGVCLDICLPMEISLAADLPDSAQPAPIEAALAARPVPGDLAGVAAVSCQTEVIDDGLRLTAHIHIAQIGADEVAVMETGDPDVWVSEAMVSRAGNTLTAVSDLVPMSGEPFDLERKGVEITLLSGEQAISIIGCPDG
ncbi:protein-disulfide reductase DsbD domain-containing protein [Actibacterium sp. XHP0104]|uniref:protein-disulfide reductase DsbD domain-containing protein n=1 Tax=Actibacterium sp. XHP0104 TaxID=2984335 RepID=UPI0021E7F296|nr:protein-disulfide reductase DsbD domain-containing protein [Actibacterium sp. XHP0104]MCV2883027.1 protein-disulfide reductase DsbD family protein [Actibacterium sp. XHP0104]